jgi:hypothetical protein
LDHPIVFQRKPAKRYLKVGKRSPQGSNFIFRQGTISVVSQQAEIEVVLQATHGQEFIQNGSVL